jgi:coenzyme Q-binding protein COQ10
MTSYTERLHLKLTARQLFHLVADVRRYPEFVPWVVAVEIHRHEGQSLWVDMTIGTSLLRRKFSSVAHLDRPHRIDISSTDLLFEHFEQRWTFEPASDSGSIVGYRLDLKFGSRLLQMLIRDPLPIEPPPWWQPFGVEPVSSTLPRGQSVKRDGAARRCRPATSQFAQ